MEIEAEAVIKAFEETREMLVIASKKKILGLAQHVCEIDKLEGEEYIHVLNEGKIVRLAFNAYAMGLYKMVDVITAMLKDGVIVPNTDNARNKAQSIKEELAASGETLESIMEKVLND